MRGLLALPLLVAVAGAPASQGTPVVPAWHEARAHIPAHWRRVGASEERAVYGADGESPPYVARVEEFWMGVYEVSNARFAAFVAATGHVSEAESEGSAFVLASALEAPTAAALAHQAVSGSTWWLLVPGATWYAPEGPGSELTAPAADEAAAAEHISPQGANASALAAWRHSSGVPAAGRAHHPVVHVSARDAGAFCAWDGGYLPREEAWEAAARGPAQGALYPWGEEWRPEGAFRANTWQGQFPHRNAERDGWPFTAPISALGAQNAWGLHGVAGNVWEWTSSEWCNGTALALRPGAAAACPGRGAPAATTAPAVVKRGGSFMCHKRTCFRYRAAARGHNTADTGAYNLGFRCAYDGPGGRGGERHEAPPPPAATVT